MNFKKGHRCSPGAHFRRFWGDFRKFGGWFWDVKYETKRGEKKRNEQKSEEKRRQETHRKGHERKKGQRRKENNRISIKRRKEILKRRLSHWGAFRSLASTGSMVLWYVGILVLWCQNGRFCGTQSDQGKPLYCTIRPRARRRIQHWYLGIEV